MLEKNISFPDHLPTLVNERVRLRPIAKTDSQALLAIRSNTACIAYLGVPPMQHEKEAVEMIEDQILDLQLKRGCCWAICPTGQNQMVGYFSFRKLDVRHHFAEIGYALLPEYFGKGFMTEVFELILSYSFNQLQLNRLEANIDRRNQASEKLLRRFGFKEEACLRANYWFEGTYLDSIIYGLLKSEYDSASPEI